MQRPMLGGEGQFLACSFWLVAALAANGRTDQARTLFERLLAEEYDVERRRQVGNFPQAFSHLAPINAARAITTAQAARDETAAEARRPAGFSGPAQAAGV
jgi:GH15 family glucan-1,4-alpha-glucosidase